MSKKNSEIYNKITTHKLYKNVMNSGNTVKARHGNIII